MDKQNVAYIIPYKKGMNYVYMQNESQNEYTMKEYKEEYVSYKLQKIKNSLYVETEDILSNE